MPSKSSKSCQKKLRDSATLREDHNPEIPPEKEESLTAIFWSFLKIGAVLFGGGYAMLPLLENEIVKHRKWCTPDEMCDTFAMAQLIPGVIAINAAMLTGHRLRGARGTLAATLGVIGAPFLALLAYAVAFDRFRESPWLLNATAGLRPAVAGMMLGVAYTLFTRTRKTRLGLAASLTAAALVLRVSAAAVILSGIGCGILWHFGSAWCPRHAPKDTPE